MSLDRKNIHSLIVWKIKTKVLWFYYKCAKIEYAQRPELEDDKKRKLICFRDETMNTSLKVSAF